MAKPHEPNKQQHAIAQVVEEMDRLLWQGVVDDLALVEIGRWRNSLKLHLTRKQLAELEEKKRTFVAKLAVSEKGNVNG